MSCCKDVNMMPVEFKDVDAQMPVRAYPTDAGLDLYSVEEVTLGVGERTTISTGISVAIPEGCAGFIWPRSGLANNHGLDVLAGLIDFGYSGVVKVILVNHGNVPVTLPKGSKIAQLVIQRVHFAVPIQVGSLDETARGDSGFGSTGV